jgi:hypothetical protein
MDSLEVMAALVRLNDSAIDSGERFWMVMASSPLSSSSVQEQEIFLNFATIAVEFGRFVTDPDINDLTVNAFEHLSYPQRRRKHGSLLRVTCGPSA